jgi:hypothetical protein
MQRTTFMLALAAAWVLSLSPGPARAQPVYKCSGDGKLTYRDSPCPSGKSVQLPPVPAKATAAAETAPANGAGATLARQKAEADRLERARLQREARDERQNRSADRTAAAYRKKCDGLRLKKKWAEQDAATTSGKKTDRARIKARRAGETLTLTCRG